MPQLIQIGTLDDFPPGQPVPVSAGGQNLLVVNTQNSLCAVQNRCSHMALPLTEGRVEGGIITCPWHSSQFNLCTGENVDWVRTIMGVRVPLWSRRLLALGRKPSPLRAYAVVVEGEAVYVEM